MWRHRTSRGPHRPQRWLSIGTLCSAHDKSDAGVAAQLADILDDFAKDMVAKAVAIAKHAEIEEREHGRIMMAM